MRPEQERGQAQITTVLLAVGLVVAGVWIWKRLPADTQDLVVDQAVPVAALLAVVLWGAWLVIRPFHRRRLRDRQCAALVQQFSAARGWEERRTLAFQLVEVNEYRLKGLESLQKELRDIFLTSYKQAVGDKQHRLRGMAASHLGVLQDPSLTPILIAALEDDHAYVRGCAALGLGRMRALEARDKLAVVMKDDWDQTVRSRAREAWERMK